MGWIKQIESLRNGAILWKHPPKKPRSDRGWQVRSSDFSIGGIDFASPVSGDFPAPMASRPFEWEVLVIGEKVTGGTKYDEAYDELAAAIGFNVPVRLVYQHDSGYERVVKAYPDGVDAPYTEENDYVYRFNTRWKLNSYWTERNFADTSLRSGGGYRSGQVSPSLRSGLGAATQRITAANFSVPTPIVDGSSVGPGGVPTIPDTAPIITFNGPVGGSLGFTLANLVDPFPHDFGNSVIGGGFNFSAPVLAGWQLIIDCGAWSATYTQGTTQIDRTDLLSPPPSQNYIAAIHPRIANQFQLYNNGTYYRFPGIATTTITDNPLTSGATTIHVASAAGYSPLVAIAIENELISFTGISGGNTLTGCTRGAFGTAAVSHPVGSGVTPMNPPWGGTINFKWRRYWL